MTDERRPGGPPPLPKAEPADSDTPTEPPPPMPSSSPMAGGVPAAGRVPTAGRMPARLGRTLQPGSLTTADIDAEVRRRKSTVKIRKSSLPSSQTSSQPAERSQPTERSAAPTHMRPISAPPAPFAHTPGAPSPMASAPRSASTMPGRPSKTRASTPPPLRGPSPSPATPPRPAVGGRPGSVPPPPPTSRIIDAAVQARLNALEIDLRELKRRPSAAPESANVAARLTRVESRLALIEEAFTPSFRTLPSRLTAIETTMSARVDQVMSAVGRMEVLSAQLEESEEELKERLDILQARGEGLERRFKESSAASGASSNADEWREELISLRKEIAERWAEESATQPWRDELAAMRETLSAAKTNDGPDLAEFEALKEELQALKSSASNESLEARIKALEAMPRPTAENVLTSVKGIGPKYAKALSANGVEAPADIAAWTDEDVLRIAEEVGASEKKVRAWRTSAKLP